MSASLTKRQQLAVGIALLDVREAVDKTVPSDALHSAAVRTNTSEGGRRALSPASDPNGSPLAPRLAE
jgi:hypothetical protein